MRTGRKGSGRVIDDEYCYSQRKICMKTTWSPEAAKGPCPAEETAAAGQRPATRRMLHVWLERVPVLERAASAGALSPKSFRKFVTEEGWRCDERRSRDPASVTLRRSFRQAGGQAPERILDNPEELCRSWPPKAPVSEKDTASPAAVRAPPRADAAARETPSDASRRPHPAQEAIAVGGRRGTASLTAAKGGARGQRGGSSGADERGAKAAVAASVPASAPAHAVLAPPPGRAEVENFTVKVRQAPDPALQESVAVPFRYSTYDPMLDVNPRLMRAFEAFPYPTRDRALRLARHTRVAVENLQAWFEAQRLKHGISWTPDEVLEARLRLRNSDTVDSDDDVVEAEEGGSGWPSGFGTGARTAAAALPPTATTARSDDGRSSAGGHGQHDDGVEGGHARPWQHAEPTARHAPNVSNGDVVNNADVSHAPEHDQVPERTEVLEPGEILDLTEVVQRGDAPEAQETSLPTHIHMALWASFHESPFPSADKLERLCTETGLTLKTVQQWFEIWRSAGRLPTTSQEGASGAFTSNWKPNWSSENNAGPPGVRAERTAPATIDIELGASDVGEDSDSDDNGRQVAEQDEGGTRQRASDASDASDAGDPSYRPGNGRKAAAAAAAQKQWTLTGHLPNERNMLQMKFEENPWPTEEVVAFLSNALKMTPLQVRKAFSYRRQQQRKKMMLAEQQQQQEQEGAGAGLDKRPARDANPKRRPPASASPGAAKGHPPGQPSEARKRSPAPAAPGDVATAITRALPLISLNEAFLLERSPSDATLRRLVEQTGLPPQDVVDFFERKRRRSSGAGGGPVAGGPPPPAADIAPEWGGPPGHVLSSGQSIEFSDEGGAGVDSGATNGARAGSVMVVIGSIGCGIGEIMRRMGGADGAGER